MSTQASADSSSIARRTASAPRRRVLTTALAWLALSLAPLASAQSGDHPAVYIMRHALAPGYGDPAQFDVQRCETQRNLNDEGRAQSRAIGQWLRTQGVEQPQVWASPWCRTKETAELLGLGPVQTTPALASFFQFGDANATTAQLRQALRDWRTSAPQRALVMVSHQVNISALTGRGTASAEVLRLQLDAQGELLRDATRSVYRAP